MGGFDQRLEEILAEGESFVQCEKQELLRKRQRARMGMVPIRELIPDIDTRAHRLTFDSLFCTSLERHHMIVLGIYRLLTVLLELDPSSNSTRLVDEHKRIVLYYPPHNYQMHPSDLVRLSFTIGRRIVFCISRSTSCNIRI